MDLPNELIDHVVQYLDEDVSSLKNLRLSARCLHDAATRYLYRKLLLYYHPKSWEKVNCIAISCKLADYVQTLQLANLEGLPEIDSFETWKSYVQQARWEVKSSAGLTGNPDIVDETLKERYENFAYWLEGEHLMDDYHADHAVVPILQLSNLPNLHSIESVGSHNLWGPKWDPNCVVDFGERDTCIARNDWTWLQSTHLLLFIISTQSTGFRLTSLKVHNFAEIHGLWFDPTFEIKELRTLEIDLRDSEDLHSAYWTNWEVSNVASWLTRLESLETFRLIQDPRLNPGIDIIDLLSKVEWPKLRHLDFKHVTTKTQCLEKFIGDHSSTLRTLQIVEPTMPMSLWEPCLKSIQDMISEFRIDLESTSSFYPSSNDNDLWYGVFTLVPP